MENNFKLITRENIKQEHICCAFSDKKCIEGYNAKKNLISSRIKDDFHFIKLDERGKVFIEFVPAEKAWAPVDADGYIFIHCFWVSGKFKGNGHAKNLLAECENFAKKNNKKGIVALSSTKKQPFISDKKFFEYQGFEVTDTAEPYFELMVKRYDKNSGLPKFLPNAKLLKSNFKEGIEIIYSDMCPFNEFYSNEILKFAAVRGIKGKRKKIKTLEEAKKIKSPTALFSIFYKGKFLTQEIFSEKKFNKVFDRLIQKGKYGNC